MKSLPIQTSAMFWLGQLIENVTGMNYEQYITTNIIDRLGLTNNELGFAVPDLRLHAKGYHKKLSFTNLLLGLLSTKQNTWVRAKEDGRLFIPFM